MSIFYKKYLSLFLVFALFLGFSSVTKADIENVDNSVDLVEMGEKVDVEGFRKNLSIPHPGIPPIDEPIWIVEPVEPEPPVEEPEPPVDEPVEPEPPVEEPVEPEPPVDEPINITDEFPVTPLPTPIF